MNGFLSNAHQPLLVPLGEELRQNLGRDGTDVQYLIPLVITDTTDRKTTSYHVPPNVMQ